MTRTTFGLLPIGRAFNFVGSPVTHMKVSDFTAEVIDWPYDDAHLQEWPLYHSILDKRFSTLDLVDFDSESHRNMETIERNKSK